MSINKDAEVIHTNIFFVDIVGLSDPTMDTRTQVKKLKFLNKTIAESKPFKSTSSKEMLVLPTGDGMAIGFLRGVELPLHLAIELHKHINAYNKGKIPKDSIRVRIGIHSGPVFIVEDLNGNKNIWGQGIIIARRVMDLGEDSHILLSGRIAEDLIQLSDEYRPILHPQGSVILKHNVKISVYSAYSMFKEKYGNPDRPPKVAPLPKPQFLYTRIKVGLSIKDPQKMLVHYRREYDIQSIKNEPVKTVFHQIATDVEKTFDELKIKVYDEDGDELQISSISIDKPDQKEFVTAFAKPLQPGELRKYFLEYEVEEPERYFENIFLTDCENFSVVMDYPHSPMIRKPVAYEVITEKDEKIRAKEQPAIVSSNGREVATWSKTNVFKGQSFRFEW